MGEYLVEFQSGFAGIGLEGPRRLAAPVALVLRRMWWETRRQGTTLPAQRGLILIDGDQDGALPWTPET